ncbi:MAG: D-2-hydroxyacid dehydrogenase [Cellulosilyticaceae bacterium]
MKICVLDAKTLGSDISLEPLRKVGEVTVYDLTDAHEIAGRIQGMDVVVTNKVILGEKELSAAPSVRLIALTATGYNNIDTIYAKANGIGVCNVAGYSTQSVAQHTFAILFQLLEQLSFYDHYVKSKGYASSDTFAYIEKPFYEVCGKRWGIIGMGDIGKAVAKLATAFGAEVVYYSTSGQNNSVSYQRLELAELLATCEIVSIHAPLNEKTQDLIGYEALKCMKKEAILLNLGRGHIVDEVALARALEENLIRGAALDVLAKEPIDEANPLYTVSESGKWLVTPHIGWASIEARTRLIEEVAGNIEAFAKGENRSRVV